MNWERLLSTKRLRELDGGRPSLRAAVELREEFERDYGRVIFSTPFRRLQDKTQVFPLDPNDSVRTRLTHSLEVSSLARTLGDQVGRWLQSKDLIEDARIASIGTITATAALIHDLGNPPFGHAGELAIQTWFAGRLKSDSSFAAKFKPSNLGPQAAADFSLFEGNAQTLRILGRLQLLSDYHGLNLTAATFSVANKYVAASNEVNDAVQQLKKPGYFLSEADLVEAVRNEVGTGAARHPLTYLVEAADDIVYSVVDLEDGIKKGLLKWNDVKEILEKEAACSDLTAALTGVKGILSGGEPAVIQDRADECSAQAFRTMAMAQGVAAVFKAFVDNYDSIDRGQFDTELVKVSTYGPVVKTCKNLARKRVYPAEATLRLELMGRTIIHDLMTTFWQSVETDSRDGFEGRLWALMSKNHRLVYERACVAGKLPPDYRRLQLVTDWVSGMTDSFASDLHQSLSNSR